MANKSETVNKAFIRKITLADNSEWTGSVAIGTEKNSIWVTLDEGYSLAEAFVAFNNSQKTSLIVATVESLINPFYEKKEYRNFTNMIDIKIQGREVLICLRHASTAIPAEDLPQET